MEGARTGLFWSALDAGDHEAAFLRLGDLPESARPPALQHLIDNTVRAEYITLGEMEIRLFEIDQHALASAESAGYGGAYRDYVERRNKVAIDQLLAWIEAQPDE